MRIFVEIYVKFKVSVNLWFSDRKVWCVSTTAGKKNEPGRYTSTGYAHRSVRSVKLSRPPTTTLVSLLDLRPAQMVESELRVQASVAHRGSHSREPGPDVTRLTYQCSRRVEQRSPLSIITVLNLIIWLQLPIWLPFSLRMVFACRQVCWLFNYVQKVISLFVPRDCFLFNCCAATNANSKINGSE